MRMPYAYAMPLPARAKSRGFRNRVRPPCRGCHGAALAQARRARRLCARRRVNKSAMVQSLQQGNRGVGAITTGARPCLIYFVMPYPFAVPYLCACVRVRVHAPIALALGAPHFTERPRLRLLTATELPLGGLQPDSAKLFLRKHGQSKRAKLPQSKRA